MTNIELQSISIVYFDKIAQLAVLSFVSFLFWAIGLFNYKFIKWVSLGFLFNFLYIFFSILTIEYFPLYNFFKTHIPDPYLLDKISSSCGILMSFCFIETHIVWYFSDQRLKNEKIFINNEFLIKQKNACVIINALFVFIVFYFTYKNIGNVHNKAGVYLLAIYSLLSITSLIIICVKVVKIKNEFKNKISKAFLLLGLGIWDVLQFIIFTNLAASVIDVIGFSLSLLAKISILYGASVWYVDITSEKKTHEETAEAYNIILRNLFHDIYIPLGGIDSSLQRLNSKVSGDLKSIYNDLVSNFERVQAIIGSTRRTFDSSVGLPKSISPPYLDRAEIVGVNHLIEQSVQSVKRIFKNLKSGNFQYSYGTNCNIKCKPAEIILIFVNIIKNSVESYLAGDEINIIIRTFKTPAISGEPRFICIEIEDDGCGIPDRILNKIWEPRFTTKEMKADTDIRGQGLYIVKDILKNYNNSSIQVESPVIKKESNNRGTKFILLFPDPKNQQ